jgi:WD40 repeat protein/serine/threonine protein kinase
MGLESAFDVGFQSSLPLPLARLYTRAHHAKGERERHDHAFHLVEAALKLGAAALAVRYREAGQRSEKVEAALQHLAQASLGHWVAIFREALGWLAAEKDPWARRIQDHLEPIVARAADVHLLLSKPLRAGGDRARVSLLDLLDLLPAYRNAMSDAHGSIKSDPTMYRENTPALLDLARLLLSGNALLGGGRLVYAEDVRMGFRGEKRVVWMALAGLAAIRCQPYDGEVSAETILPGRLYWEITAGEHIPLFPLLHYRPGEVLDQVFFLNRARNGAQFLCYTTGEFYVPGADSEGMRLLRQLAEMLSSLPPRSGNGREAEEIAVEDCESPPGRRFGDFDIEERIGQGGMGVVYHARQRSLDRPVALKFLPQAMEDDPVALARFKQEVRALARCDHPNVVKVVSAGQVNGTHHYAMEFISGCDLSSIARELESLRSAASEPLEERAFDLAVSAALRRCPPAPDCPPVPAVAEGNGGRERGSRPLGYRVAEVMRDAARGVQHIHDQGIIHRDIKPQNIMITGQEHRPVIMDLGLAKLIGGSRGLTRSGKSPGTTRYMPPEQLQHNLLEVDARADVYALGAVAYELVCHRPMMDGDTEERLTAQILFEEPPHPQRANPAVPADLATIIAKATRKDPRERYPSAAALANDLDSFVHGRPIVARPPSAGYLLKLFFLRNPALVTAAAAAAIVIVGLVTGWVASLRRAWHDEHRATLEKVEALKRLRGLYLSAEAKRLSESRPDLAAILAIEGARHERTLLSNNALVAVLENLNQLRVLAGHTRELSCAAFDPSGRKVATASWDCTARIWDVETAKEIAILEGHDDRISWVAFDPGGVRVATASLDWTARIWDIEGRSEPLVLEGHADKVAGVCFSPRGDRLLTASWDRSARIWDARTGETIIVLGDHRDRVNGASWSPDGRLVATASSDGTAHIRDASSGEGIWTLAGSDERVLSVDFSPDGRWLVTASWDRTARIWSTQTGESIRILRGHEDAAYSARFSPDGLKVLTGSWDKTARIWDARTGEALLILRGHADKVHAAAFSPRGDLVVTASQDTTACIWSTRSWKDRTTLRGHENEIWSTAFGSGGSRVITASDDGTVRIWDLETRAEILRLEHRTKVSSARLSRDGERVATSSGREAHVWDARTRERLFDLRGHDGSVNSVEFSPDGRRLVTASYDGTVRLWDGVTGAQIRELKGHEQRVHHAGFSPDGDRVVSSGRDRTVRLWDARTGASIAIFEGHQADVYAAEFSPDGRRLISASQDKTARLWDEGGRVIRVLGGHTDAVFCVSLSPDGRMAATCSKDKTARIWDLASGREVCVLEGHDRDTTCSAFSPDGRLLVTASVDGTARMWPVDPLPLVIARRPRDPTPAESQYYELGTPEERRLHSRRRAVRMIREDTRILAAIFSRTEKPQIRHDLLADLDRLAALALGEDHFAASLRASPDLFDRIRSAICGDPELAALGDAVDVLERLRPRLLVEP